MLKEAGSVGALVIAVFCEVRYQAKLTKAVSLREAIHTLPDLEVDSVVVEERL
jgi:hypothetical protein